MGCRAQRPLDYGSNLIIGDSPRSAGTKLLQRSTTPLANCMFVDAELGSHILARQSVRTPQNDAASLR
jgi:hypothetical protein